MSFWKNKKVLITGASGFVGKNLVKSVSQLPCEAVYTPRSSEYDLTNESDVERMFQVLKPDIVLHLAGKVGGIWANKTYQADFFYQNIMMGTLIMEHARRAGVEKLVALAAGCGYPLKIDVPYSEEDFWRGLPDENTRAYSMAKKNLIIQSWAYREQHGFNSVVLLPANLYGPNDNFDLMTSHVVPALIRKFVEAKENKDSKVVVWGSGKAAREFLYVEDVSKVIIDTAEKINETGPFNLGTGTETTILELVENIKEITEFEGDIVWDSTKPDGQMRRFYDMSNLKQSLGYVPNTPLAAGLKNTIDWYRNNH